MRIVFSTDQIYLHGGIEKVMAEKANYFAEVLGFEVYVLTCEQKGKPNCYALSEKVKRMDMGINYQREKSYFSFDNLKRIPVHFYRLTRALYRINPDVVIVSNYGFDHYMMPFIHGRSKKIKEFHSSRYYEEKRRILNASSKKRLIYQFNDWIESRYDRIVVLNKDEVPFYKSSNVVVIPNPVGIPKQQALLENKRVVAAGRIAPIKGFDKLIEAWKLVQQTDPDCELHIYGEDYLNTTAKLSNFIKEHSLESSVYFKGTSANMTETFLGYSIYAMSSETECFPMVLLEALSVGLPIVSFDCPTGPANIVSNGEDGFLCKDQNPEDLAAKLLILINDVQLRKTLGAHAKRNSLRFRNSEVINKWKHLFESIT